MAKASIGTSGFMYPHWRGEFYPSDLPQRKWFEYYLKHFNSLELNASFYRLPKKEVFAGWRKKAGKDFIFSIKGSRFITHVKKLKDCQEEIKTFFAAADFLNQGNEVVLWQLPSGLRVNLEKLKLFLKILPKNWRHAFEFRDKSWIGQETLTLLRYRNEVKTAVVFQDWRDWPIFSDYANLCGGPERLVKELPFIYLRFHGNRALYSSGYTQKELRNWALEIKKWLKQGKDVYVYFNNDALGYAISNAKTLKKLLE